MNEMGGNAKPARLAHWLSSKQKTAA